MRRGSSSEGGWLTAVTVVVAAVGFDSLRGDEVPAVWPSWPLADGWACQPVRPRAMVAAARVGAPRRAASTVAALVVRPAPPVFRSCGACVGPSLTLRVLLVFLAVPGAAVAAPPPPPVLFASLPSTALVFCSNFCSCFLFLSCPQKVRSAPATAVAWAPDGGRYLLVTDKVVSVYLATGELAASLEHPKRVLAAVFTSPVGVATAGEERVIKVRWGMGGWGGCA